MKSDKPEKAEVPLNQMMLDGEPAPYGTADSREMLDAVLEYVRQNGRVCPMPSKWNELWKMLPARRRVGSGSEPPLPLILAAWYTPALLKMKRLEEHIRYADAHGALVKVDRYLRGLPENEWAHLSDFGRTASGANASDGADELEG